MNIIEREIVDVLKSLKEEHGVFEIKAEFEAEGSRMEELMRLKDVTTKIGLPIILKIGGVEAVTDIFNALSIGVTGIIAPMAETPFAVSKFLNSVKKFVPDDNAEDIDFAINIETINAYDNLDRILELPNINILHAITVGRVDLVGSLQGDRSIINSDKMLEICVQIFTKARVKNMRCGLGGGISTDALDFIKYLVDKKLIDKYETRKVVYHADAVNKNPHDGLLKGIEFELLWLKNKQRFYSRIKTEDANRIQMIERRLQNK